MPSLPLLKPALYDEAEHPSLAGGRCTCGYVFFPMQSYGCEKCGRFGDDLQPMKLAGHGKLLASAAVHMHAGKGRQAPFIVGSIALDDGPIVRTLIAGSEGNLEPGDMMTTVLMPVVSEEDGTEHLDLRFTPLREGAKP